MRPTPALLISLMLAGCGARPTPHWAAPDEGVAASTDYEGSLKDWTRSGQNYELFDTRASVYATYLSPRFVADYTAHQGDVEGLPDAEIMRLRAARIARAEQEARFLVSLSTREMPWDDLGRGDGTMRVVLREGEDEIKPISLIKLTRQEMMVTRLYYPHLSPLTNGYWITFPKPSTPKAVTLRIAGPPGQIDLKWESR